MSDEMVDFELLFPYQRVSSDVNPIIGEFKLNHCGYVILQFDNTFSWLTSKTLTYHIELHLVRIFARV